MVRGISFVLRRDDRQNCSYVLRTNKQHIDKKQGNKGGKKAGKAPSEFDEPDGTFPTNEEMDKMKSTVKKGSRSKVTEADFSILKVIGKGSFGTVFMVKKKDTGKPYAMKVLDKDKVMKRKQYEHTLSERRILQDIDHPFLIGLRFSFQTKSKLYMVFDFFNGGELYTYISKGKFTEERAKFYAAEILLGLGHLHEHNIVYRDLKPENLLLDRHGHIRICDFGLSKQDVTGDSVKSICGTPEYLAPEVIRRKPDGSVGAAPEPHFHPSLTLSFINTHPDIIVFT